ncbi:beta-lactamase family protein [Planotetraspora sp. A-T 1434]|uniref:serine hydrolase domain-containing protein n=1 Tax=Planotetraspora sp. A-T 1434 TaxID=2979219 RepID=UPI0021BE5CEA|nr:serine hydrolase domain-containing protein [Planotetraspora sp. A-T 1434]MCT9935258.1 beta-lactamase family protein [Planotetraspora sp. A-T 1434]
MIELLNRPHVPTFLKSQFAALARDHQVCGAQLVIQHDDETVAIEVGEIQHGGGRPVTRDTAFPIGSVTKSFTATLAMTLVADGDLDLDEPLGGHLPELGELGHRLTLRHLLSHTAGFACGPDSTEVATSSPRRYITDHCGRQNLVLPPGAGFSYSNMGYVIAGRLVEVITGMSWTEAMASILLRPLGIAPSFICPVAGRPSGRPIATGHSVNLALGRTQPVQQSLAPPEAPAGALAMSAMDLVALGRTHVPPGVPGLLPPGLAVQMRRPVPAANPFGLADGWGLGFAVFRDEATEWIGHDGNADGTSCYLRVDPVDGWIVALTTNTSSGIGLWRELGAQLADAGIPIPGDGSPAAAAPPAVAPPDCVGVYANGDSEFVVTGSDGCFSLAVDGSDFMVLASADGLTFSLMEHSSGQRLPGGRFQRDPDTGEINGIQVNGRLARRRPYVPAMSR